MIGRWLGRWFESRPKRSVLASRPGLRLAVELLEDRCLPAAGVDLQVVIRNFFVRTENFAADSGSVLDGAVTSGVHKVLRFDLMTYNGGDEDLVLGRPEDNPDIFVYSNAHGHYHLRDFNDFQLLNLDGTTLAPGAKQSFCVADTFKVDPNAPPKSQVFSCAYQGLSQGYADLYAASLPGQFVVIDGIADGDFILQATCNFGRHVTETDYTDNTAWAYLHIQGSTVTQIAQPEIHVNSRTVNNQVESASASTTTGRSVVVWTDQPSPSASDIRAQVYDAQHKKLGREIVVASGSALQHQPAVAMDVSGNFVVVWTEEVNGNQDVLAQRFSPTGLRRGDVIPVATGDINEFEPSVAKRDLGGFVVSYTAETAPGNTDVLAVLYNKYGKLLDTIDVATGPTDEAHSSVARTPQGRFNVAYEVDDGSGDANVAVARFDANGVFKWQQIVNSSSDRNDSRPSIAIDSAGRSVLVFQAGSGSDADVLAVTVSDIGVVGPEISVAATSMEEADPAVAMLRAGGKFFVAYRVGAAGLGSSVHVTTLTTAGTVLSDKSIGLGWAEPALSLVGSHFYLVSYTSEATRREDWGRGIFGRFTKF